jgi:ribose 5-phosphate isomerase A
MNTKKIAAEKAVESIKDGMIVGLGTGSTSYWAIQRIGERVKEGLKVKAVASSKASEDLAQQAGILLVPFAEVTVIDIYIDGADEVDAEHNLIKGGGGALLREKILASNSRQFIVIVDESKLVQRLGKFPLPVEIVPFASSFTLNKIRQLNEDISIRQKDGRDFISDNGNLIVDCRFEEIADPEKLNLQLHNIPGVVETGLFLKAMVSAVIAGYEDGMVKVIG